MNLNILHGFRNASLRRFYPSRDALFNSVDALLTQTQILSFAELSLSPPFEQRWYSLYEAFEDRQIDLSRLSQVFAKYPLPTGEGE